jgi:hypothetical protein
MDIKIASYHLTAFDGDVEGHGVRAGNERRLAEIEPAGTATLEISLEGGVLALLDLDDVEGHMWRRGRLVEIGNDVVEVSDANGVVRRYVRVGGTPRRTDAVVLQYRSGAGPRF